MKTTKKLIEETNEIAEGIVAHHQKIYSITRQELQEIRIAAIRTAGNIMQMQSHCRCNAQ